MKKNRHPDAYDASVQSLRGIDIGGALLDFNVYLIDGQWVKHCGDKTPDGRIWFSFSSAVDYGFYWETATDGGPAIGPDDAKSRVMRSVELAKRKSEQ